MTQDTWRSTTFEQTIARRGSGTWQRWVGGLMVVAAFAAWLHSQSRASLRCHQECYGEPPRDGFGSRTFEPGHPWTQYADSWQWSVQHGLVQLAVLVGIAGLGLALTRRRGPVALFGVTALLLAGWAVWVLLSPPVP